MTTPVSHWHVRRAARVLKAGGVIAYPTDTVFGLGCDPHNPLAVLRLLGLKHRAAAKGLIVIAADFEQLVPFLHPRERDLCATLTRPEPRPVTWLVDAPAIPPWIRGDHPKAAVRIVKHRLAAALCRAFGGPIVSTSANVSGGTPARTALKVRLLFGRRLDYVLAGEAGPSGRPSEIRDARTGLVHRQ